MSDKEERILIEREYVKHLERIEKATVRERHFEMKDVGYTRALNLLGSGAKVVPVFLGYIEALGIDKRSIYNKIADAVLDGNHSVVENLFRVLDLKIASEDAIGKEIVKTSSGQAPSGP